jgi:hypothetical protein
MPQRARETAVEGNPLRQRARDLPVRSRLGRCRGRPRDRLARFGIDGRTF